ncbi:hypothetical protein [Rhodanobacter ginsengiterrae]
MLHVIATVLSLLLLAGVFGSGIEANDEAAAESTESIDAAQGVIEPEA